MKEPTVEMAALALVVGFLCFSRADAGSGLDPSWSDGIRLEAPDGSVKLKLGGRLQDDWVFQRGEDSLLAALGDSTGPAVLEDGTEFRRVRFYFSGVVGRITEFKSQLDFAGGSVAVKDLYVGVKKIPALGTVRVGNQYEPMGLNEMTSSKYITFIERATPMIFSASRRAGLLATNRVGPVMWTGMFWRESSGVGKSVGSGEYNVTGRVAVVPYDEDGGRRLVHVGVAASRRSPTGDAVEYSSRPENHLAPRYVSASVAATDVNVFAGEGAVVLGPLSVQGEILQAATNSVDGKDPAFLAYYAFASFFLTGEHRPYSASTGTFGRVKPRSSFDGEGGKGAWEAAARFSHLDLDDAGVTGGRLDDVTVGLNWYLNPNFRWMLDYVHADLEKAGTSNAVLTRFQTDF